MEVGYLSHGQKCARFFEFYWKSMVLIITPVIFLPIMAFNGYAVAYRCMYVLCIMAIYWVTEVMPLAITSLLPIVLFPLLEILNINTTCTSYMKPTVVMFVGGLIIALAIEFCNLHKRIALRTIQIVGCSTGRLFFGLIFVTMFISFWITNTAATAMMCPIIDAVLQELEREGTCEMYEIIVNERGCEIKRPKCLTIAFFLGAAYASTIGGSGTLIGSGTNLTFKGVFETRFPQAGPINFTKWMLFAAPLAIISTFVTWLWLQFAFMGLWRPNSSAAKCATIGPEAEASTRMIIDIRYEELGPMNTHEKSVLTLFILAIILFLTHDPGFVPGWGAIFPMKISDAVPAISIVLLLFIFPVNYSFLKFFRYNKEESLPQTNAGNLITWNFVQSKLPWGLIFLLGSGFAIGEAGKQSGMSRLLSDVFSGIESLPNVVILLLVCSTASFLTEFTANVPITNILLPVVAEISLAIEVNPIYLMLPAAICCSWAFHTAVGTPPNAIVAGYAHITSGDFIIGGIGPTIITLLTIWIGFPTWGSVVYPESTEFPEWAREEAMFAKAKVPMSGVFG